MGRQVLMLWPNIIGYIRMCLVLTSWISFSRPTVFMPLYSISVVLDGVDGWLARRLGQTSRFGAWLDVVVDNLGRSMLWSQLFTTIMVLSPVWGWWVSSVEWCVFVCNHSARGSQWKSSFTSSPHWVQAVMAKGFRTPLGVWVVSGLHCLPLWLYADQSDMLSLYMGLHPWLQTLGTAVLAQGRLLGLSVEIWCIYAHIKYLTKDDMEKS